LTWQSLIIQDDYLVRVSRETVSEISRDAQGIQTNHSVFSHSGQELFLTTGDGTIRILDYPTMSPLYSFKAQTSSSFCVELSPNAKTLAVGGTDAVLTLWDTTDWYCKKALSNLNGPVRSVSFSWCGGYVVSGGEDRIARITHVASGEEVKEIMTGSAPVVQWSPRDYALAYAVQEKGGGLRIYSPPANVT
jgi:THO complex subunit 3